MEMEEERNGRKKRVKQQVAGKEEKVMVGRISFNFILWSGLNTCFNLSGEIELIHLLERLR